MFVYIKVYAYPPKKAVDERKKNFFIDRKVSNLHNFL